MEKKKDFFEGSFGKYLLPPIILQSVLIGGGYATGREIVSYGAKYGAVGWIAGIFILIGFALISILSFEFARTFKVYDYRSMLKKLIGKFWFLYDIVYVLLLVLIIAVMASATGEIVQDTLGIPYWFGVFGVVIVVGLLHFYGEHVIERFKTYGTAALYLGYVFFGFTVLATRWDQVMNTFQTADTSFMAEPFTMGAVIWTGIVYVGYNLAVYPASFFTLRRQTTRQETVISGIISGFLMTLPWFLTYLCIMAFYPSEEVMGASVPWLVMLTGTSPLLTVMFGIVVGWTLIETSTGIIHGFVDRVDSNLKEIGNPGLTRQQSAVLAVVLLLAATVLARVGIVDLIAVGYYYMGYAMILTFAVPLLTVGVFRILNPEWTSKFLDY